MTKDNNELDYIVKQAKKIPRLTQDEEYALSKLAQSGDPAAKKRLINAYILLVIKIAHGFSGYIKHNPAISLSDLVQQGFIGLSYAVNKINPDKSKLSTYASLWIKSYMNSFIMSNFSIIKMGTSNHERKMFSRRGELVSNVILAEPHEREEARKKFAQKHNIAIEHVKNFERRLSSKELSIDEEFGRVNSGDYSTRHDTIASKQNTFKSVSKKSISDAVKRIMDAANLTEREVFVVSNRHKTDDITLKELSKVLKVSRQRVDQINKNALRKARIVAQEMYQNIEEII